MFWMFRSVKKYGLVSVKRTTKNNKTIMTLYLLSLRKLSLDIIDIIFIRKTCIL